jgi:hypothetical protein
MATYPQTPYDEPYDHSRAKEDARNEWQHYEDDPDSGPPPADLLDTMDDPAAQVQRDRLMPQACGACGGEIPADGKPPDHLPDCSLALKLSTATARKILDQLWEGVMAGLHDSRLHDELIRAGWPQFQGYAGGEAGICMHCQQPIQHCKHAMPCPEGFEHSTDLLHHCYGGVADTVAEPAAASVRPLPGHPVLEGAGYDCHCGACEAQPGYVPRQKLQPTE